jgi:predicted aminopeptidase
MNLFFVEKKINLGNYFNLNLFLLLQLILFSNCIGYLGHLAVGQSEILWKREKISVLLDSTIDEKLRAKFSLINQARKYAATDLSLNPEGGFEYFTSLDREEVGWHVTASYPLKFESYTWWFPIVGSVPYKGYFDMQKAREEEEYLSQKGLDARLRITSGYSTLGWFSDPLLSPQLRLRDDELIALVFHEMAHSTIYFNGDSDFNESYASFVEDIGTQKFYESMQTDESREILRKRNQSKKEKKIVFGIVKEIGEKLKAMYDTELSDAEKFRRKGIYIEEFRNKILDSSSDFEMVNMKNFKNVKINNETFLSVLRYNSGERFFQEQFEKSGNQFQKFHENLKKFQTMSKEDRKKLLNLE